MEKMQTCHVGCYKGQEMGYDWDNVELGGTDNKVFVKVRWMLRSCVEKYDGKWQRGVV